MTSDSRSNISLFQRLTVASEDGNIAELYSLLGEDANLLRDVDKVPFIQTPMHVAAKNGNTNFVLEMFHLTPSFARKLNPDGFSPMHLALQNRKFGLLQRLVELNPDLSQVKGKGGNTIWHSLFEENTDDEWVDTENGCISELMKFAQDLVRLLNDFPESIRTVNSQGETSLLIAVRNKTLVGVSVVLTRLGEHDKRKSRQQILDWKNNKGEAAIHLAISTDQPQVLRLLIKAGANVNLPTSQGVTAIDLLNSLGVGIISNENRKMMETSLKEKGAKNSRWVELHGYERTWDMWQVVRKLLAISFEETNVLQVVAALIVSATYQSLFAVSGTGGGDVGKRLLLRMNVFAFYLSMVVLVLLIPTSGGFYAAIMWITVSSFSLHAYALGESAVGSGKMKSWMVLMTVTIWLISLNKIVIQLTGINYPAKYLILLIWKATNGTLTTQNILPRYSRVRLNRV